MIERGESFTSGFAFGALLQTMAVIGGVVCGWAADRSGNLRATLALTWLGGAIAIAMLAFVNLHWVNIAGIALAGFFMMGAQPVLNNLTAGLYDTEIRGTGVGVELGVGRIGGILGPYIGGLLQQIFPGSLALYLAMAIAAAVSGLSITVAALRLPPC
jgi:AAHS family 4-hydroxybenzoate transporter-like MFS transporter